MFARQTQKIKNNKKINILFAQGVLFELQIFNSKFPDSHISRMYAAAELLLGFWDFIKDLAAVYERNDAWFFMQVSCLYTEDIH
jgi:hypothetical protein